MVCGLHKRLKPKQRKKSNYIGEVVTVKTGHLLHMRELISN